MRLNVFLVMIPPLKRVSLKHFSADQMEDMSQQAQLQRSSRSRETPTVQEESEEEEVSHLWHSVARTFILTA